jgi:glycosyltransferase involved in cell wall biosynthesis
MSSRFRVSTITPCFHGEKYLEGFFESVRQQTLFEHIQVVLVHNEPTDQEIEIVRKFQRFAPDTVKHIVVFPEDTQFPCVLPGRWARETIAQSMNRAIANADAEYVAIWNVDDLRTPDSLEREIEFLDAHSDIAFTYGDMVMVRHFGSREGVLVPAPEFEQVEFLRGCFGGFQMFRKSICDQIGYFDEQLRSGADFDLWVRIAANFVMAKTPGVLGYYLNAGTGISTGSGALQPIERTVIELRYGIYDKLDYRYLPSANRYRIHDIYFSKVWHPAGKFIPNYEGFLRAREPLRTIGIQNFRRAQWQRAVTSVVQNAKIFFRRFSKRLGIYDSMISLRDRLRSR